MNKENILTFSNLIQSIQQINTELTNQASRAINVSLTLRNWCIGAYISEYELSGSDRARYGDKLLAELATSLNDVSNCQRRQLYDYLHFYRT
jgi:hypothetical protein